MHLAAHRGKTRHGANKTNPAVHQQWLKAIWPRNFYSQQRKIDKGQPQRGLLDNQCHKIVRQPLSFNIVERFRYISIKITERRLAGRWHYLKHRKSVWEKN